MENLNIEIKDDDLDSNYEFFLFAYNEVRDCIREAYGLKAKEDFILKDKSKIHAEILEAKNFLAEKPEYQKYLNNLQTALYQQNITVFNQLLTYFVRDVLKSEKGIEMELFVYRNLPALRIEAINDGFSENIINGSGGAVANIVSTGLRLICLSRLQNRKFIILDEPDCWIKPEFVPDFAKIVGELSKKLHIQTVIISHHSWLFFKDYGRVIELSKDGSILTNRIIHDTAFDEKLIKQDYIKEITIRRFMSHHDTTYNLHPYLTCIIGDHDIGKSVIGPAVKAVAFNESSDSYVKHHESNAQVYIKTSTGNGFLWERFEVQEKGQEQKVKYSLFKDDIFVTSEFNANYTPSFISDKLNIKEVEDIDVHISNQKTPVFMIGNEVKPQNKAKILSLGKEIIIIQKMMEHINSVSLEYSGSRNRNEKLYEKYVRELKVLHGISDEISELEKIQQGLEVFKENVAESDILSDLLPKLKILKKVSSETPIALDLMNPSFEDEVDINESLWSIDSGSKYSKLPKLNILQSTPSFEDVEKIKSIISSLEQLRKVKNLNKFNNIEIPNFEDEKEISKTITSLKSLKDCSRSTSINPLKILYLEDEDELNTILFKLDSDAENINALNLLIKNAEKKKKENSKKREELDIKIAEYYESVGNVCPTCKQSVTFNLFKEHLL